MRLVQLIATILSAVISLVILIDQYFLRSGLLAALSQRVSIPVSAVILFVILAGASILLALSPVVALREERLRLQLENGRLSTANEELVRHVETVERDLKDRVAALTERDALPQRVVGALAPRPLSLYDLMGVLLLDYYNVKNRDTALSALGSLIRDGAVKIGALEWYQLAL